MGTTRDLGLTQYIFGMDSSVYDDNKVTPQRPDFVTAKANGILFDVARASFSLYEDKDFDINWNNKVLAGIPQSAYHFLVWEKSPEEQANFYWSVIKDKITTQTLWTDFEWWSTIPSNAFDILYRFLERLKILAPNNRIGIYTAKGFWDQYGTKDPYWLQYDLWLAHWNSSPPISTAEIPLPWKNVVLWQYSGHGDGKYYGMESNDVDLDYFMGTKEEFARAFNTQVGEPMTDYTQNAIGLVTKEAGWTNPNFNFIVGYAGGNWTKRADGTYVLDANVNLKPIETQARNEGKPFLALWDFDVSYYANQQYMATEDKWPTVGSDYPLQSCISALTARDFDGLIVRVMDKHNDLTQKEELLTYVSFAARKFVERINKWLYTTKGLNKQTLVMTNDQFLRQANDGAQEYFYAWIKKEWPPVVVEQAAVTIVSNAYPDGVEKPGAVGDTNWKAWYYFWPSRTKNFITEPIFFNRTMGLMIYNGTDQDMRTWLQLSTGTPPPPPPPPDTDTDLTQLKTDVEALKADLQALRDSLKPWVNK